MDLYEAMVAANSDKSVQNVFKAFMFQSFANLETDLMNAVEGLCKIVYEHQKREEKDELYRNRKPVLFS